MPTLVFAACKGGSGKTTLSAAIAAEALRRKETVALLDLDPQQSLARWHELRVESVGEDLSPMLVPTPLGKKGRHIDSTIAVALANELDWLLVDTAPGSVVIVEQAIAAADLVLIPVRPSPLDVEAVDTVVEICQEQGKPFAFILNGTTARSSMTTGAKRYLDARGPVLDGEVVNRQTHAVAMMSGKTAAETDPKGPAAAEISDLMKAIVARLKKAKGGK
jgi:chromosome partitioning protein